MNNKLVWSFLGRIPYSKSLDIQRSLQNNIISGEDSLCGQILFLEHKPVITVGKFGSKQNLLASRQFLKQRGIELYKTERGGDFTYHGPGQLVCYPVLNLKKLGFGVKKYIYLLEEVIIQTLKDCGIDAQRKDKFPGVWVGDSKIAFLGIYVKKHVTMHGFSLNIEKQADNFSHFIPCGISDLKITSVSEVTGRKIKWQETIGVLVEKFERELEVKIENNEKISF
jgi:lipoate-protein ligase B